MHWVIAAPQQFSECSSVGFYLQCYTGIRPEVLTEAGGLLGTGDGTSQVCDGKVLALLRLQGLSELLLPCGPHRAAEGLAGVLVSHTYSLVFCPSTGTGVRSPNSQDCLSQSSLCHVLVKQF